MRSCAAWIAVPVVLLSISAPVLAGHHQWDISEVFSNSDGTIQFVEIFGIADNEQGLNGFGLTSNSGGSFTFNANLPSSSTANTWTLVATSGFAALPAAPAPDYVLPDNFFDASGDTIVYAGGADSWAFGAVPINGVDSLDRTSGVGRNSPTNFAGASGSVNASGIPAAAPVTTIFGVIVLVGIILLMTSGMLRRRPVEPVQPA